MNMNIVSGIRTRSGKSCAAQLPGAEKKPMIRPAIVQDAADFSSPRKSGFSGIDSPVNNNPSIPREPISEHPAFRHSNKAINAAAACWESSW